MKQCPLCYRQFDDDQTFCTEDGEVLQLDYTTLVGSTLDGQYHIEKMLGRGGMGTVYRARHLLLGDRVALKVLAPEMRNDAEWLQRFQREGQAARRFRHPNVVTVYDLRATSDGLNYLVMEYVEGVTLTAELKSRRSFTQAETWQIIEPILSALQAAHETGVVHRDIKPDNIMMSLNEQGALNMKLLDLGVAKMEARSERQPVAQLTVVGQMLGTPFYMSPEQWGAEMRDGGTEADARADIYSLGLVIYEMLAGKKPFAAQNMYDLRQAHLSSMPPPLTAAKGELSAAFAQAVMRAIAKDRADRPASMAELTGELRAGMPADADPQPLKNLFAFKPKTAAATQSGRLDSEEARAVLATAIGQKTDGAENLRAQQTRIDAPRAPTENVNPQPHNVPRGNPTAAPVAPPQTPIPPLAVQPPPASPPPTVAVASTPPPAQRENVAQSSPLPTAPSANIAPPQNFQPAAPPVVEPLRPNVVNPTVKRRSIFPALAGAAIIFLIVGTVAAIFIWRQISQDKNENVALATTTSGDTRTNTTATAEPAQLDYWLRLKSPVDGKQRVTGAQVLRSGGEFELHFLPAQNGYLYLIGTGKDDHPTLFLSATPSPDTGVSSNRLRAGQEFVLKNLAFDQDDGTDVISVIFSDKQLDAPQFFVTAANRELNAGENTEWKSLRSRLLANQSVVSVSEGGAENTDKVSVKPARDAARDLWMFEIELKHQ